MLKRSTGTDQNKGITMNGRLKAKKLGSATLAHSWPKPVFPFKGSVGHHPVEAQPYVFVSRYDRKTGRQRVVPEMTYPIQANRQPVPLHQVLEDEYRAFHSVYMNQLALQRKFFPNEDQQAMFALTRSRAVAIDQVIETGKLAMVKDSLPPLLAYNPGVAPPPGYMYRRYKQAELQRQRDKNQPPDYDFVCPPSVIISEPFQNMVNWKRPPFCEPAHVFDSGVVGCGNKKAQFHIYNEPSAVSAIAIKANFDHRLSKRARPKKEKAKGALEDTPTNITA